jgi:type IV pilus assembly protein PilC
MFEGLGAQLPLPTRIVIFMSNWFVRLLPFLVIFSVAFVFLFKRYYATHAGKRVIDRIILRLPILGILMQKIAVARFCRTLATLISSGVPILDGLEITARTAGNSIIEDAIMAVRKAVEGGLTLAQPLKESGVFPNMVVQMIGVGEQTGALDAMLSKIAEFYEEEVDQAVANLLTLMEPVMILFLGVTVGGIVISMYLPLFDLISKLS